MNYAVVLAGGIGSRFWPLSRELEPKQFLNLYSNKSMIEETIGRIKKIIRKENIYVATSKIYNQKIKKYLKKLEISLENILLEPKSKNTFAPIAVLSRKINNLDPDALIIALPSDHLIKDKKRFLKLLCKGMEIARSGYIVTLGIPPKRPETGYGYIRVKPKVSATKVGGAVNNFGGRLKKPQFYGIDRFIEKPSLKIAKRFIKDKRYYWNSGIFIFRSQAILEEIKKFMPHVYKSLIGVKSAKYFYRLWHKLPCTSIDYGIMEKTKRMVLLPLDCGWVDLGSWEAVGELAKKDKNGNISRGSHLDIGSKNSLVWAGKRLIATLGLNNIIIVDSGDALLVCRSDMSQDVKKIVGLLKQKNYKGRT